MLKKLTTTTSLLIIILIVAFFLRVYRLDYPDAYVFDEVYHAFTAKEYLTWTPQSWEWWNTPPPGVAYEWTHPPLAKEFMALSMLISQTTDPWAWRISGVLINLLAIWTVFLLGKQLFKSERIGLIAAFVFSLDGLNFVQSRTGMNDSYVVAFILLSLLFFLKKKLFISALFFGLAISSKWAAFYLFGVYLILILLDNHRSLLEKWLYAIPMFIVIPGVVYLLCYIPFFLLGHNLSQFYQLQNQMWWYHTNLKATHDYTSRWWSWPFNLYPVWYYVQYYPNGNFSNIFASGNTGMFLFGFGSILLSIWDVIRHRVGGLAIVLLCFGAFLLPWAASPRIMFLYHYSPCVPFLSLALAYQLNKLWRPKSYPYFWIILTIIVISFALYFPVLTGIELPRSWMRIFFATNLTKNPFGEL